MNNRGRPKKEVRKSKVLKVRLNDEEEKNAELFERENLKN